MQQVLEYRLLFEFLREIISFVAVAERDIVYRLRATFKREKKEKDSKSIAFIIYFVDLLLFFLLSVKN